MKLIASAILILGILGLAGAQTPSSPEQGPLTTKGSLFNQAVSTDLIAKRTALHKGDIVTIIVSESATGSTSAQTTSSKKDATNYTTSLPAVSAVTNQFLTGLLNNISSGILGGSSVAANSATAGNGATSTNTAFSTQITAVVTEVKPNGVLTVEGKRTFKMNKQTQTMVLQGILRIDDISSSNTILSQNVADLRLVAEGKGLIADRQREGLLTKLLSWIF